MPRKINPPTLTVEELEKILNYNPTTGAITFKVSRGPRSAGSMATHKTYGGYIAVMVCGRSYRAHRIAWALAHRHWPTHEIDHINGERSDNRLVNLREATSRENAKNLGVRSTNTSGYKGVHFHRQSGKWRARICVDYKYVSLGLFVTPECAYAAYCNAARKHFGNMARAA